MILNRSTIQHSQACKRDDISRKPENSKVIVRLSHGARIRYMAGHVKPVLRDKADHTVFHIGTNVPSNKTPET